MCSLRQLRAKKSGRGVGVRGSSGFPIQTLFNLLERASAPPPPLFTAGLPKDCPGPQTGSPVSTRTMMMSQWGRGGLSPDQSRLALLQPLAAETSICVYSHVKAGGVGGREEEDERRRKKKRTKG